MVNQVQIVEKTNYSQELKSYGIKYSLSVVAAAFAETATYPLDLTKTRLQIQGEIANGTVENSMRRGMFGIAIDIVKDEGLFRLWQGLSPALVRHTIYATRYFFYEIIREKFMGEPALWKKVVAGAAVGAMAQFLSNPTDLVKVQLQMEGRRRLQGYPPRVHGMMHALRTMVKEGGWLSLWRGSVPNIQRAALVNLGDLATYDTAKRFLITQLNLSDSVTTHAASSTISGLVAAILSTPADVVKTRIMNQPLTASGKGQFYISATDCFVKTVKNEGFFALYKGFIPIWARMAPWSLTFWVSYEKIRNLTGVESF